MKRRAPHSKITRPTRTAHPAQATRAHTEATRALAEGGHAWSTGKIETAATAFAHAALLAPDMAQAHSNLGVALRKMGRVEAALTSYRRALALTPDDPALHSNLGNALRALGRLAEAEEHLSRAVAARPEDQSFAYNLALAIRDRRRQGEARQRLAALCRANPANAEMIWDLALTDLYLKDYVQGFAGYEARWRLPRLQARDLPGERWQPGTATAGKRVLITAEQGFGDALQFARFLPLVARQSAELVVECQPELMELFAAIPGVARVVEKNAPLPAHDLWAPMMSLAWLLGVTWETLPAPRSYLTAPRKLETPLGRPPGTRLNVGLVWAGKTTPRDRSWPLEDLLPLMEDPRVTWWSLQMGERVADLGTVGADRLVRNLAPRLRNFADTAATMSELDMVVTIDSGPAHLAAALGRPTWILLRYVSDWRWLDEGDTCAWYPSVRLFRQPTPDDFTTPVTAMKAALDEVLARSR